LRTSEFVPGGEKDEAKGEVPGKVIKRGQGPTSVISIPGAPREVSSEAGPSQRHGKHRKCEEGP